MKITIGGQDYTAALDSTHPLTIERRLNAPSKCHVWLCLPANGSLATPARNQYLTVAGDNGTIYFTGYLAAAPLPEYAGVAVEGPRYRIAIEALSDEALLDQAQFYPSAGTAGLTVGALMAALVTRTGSTALAAQALTLSTPVSNFAIAPGASWSKSAGAAANEARSAYRALNGALTLSSIPNGVHVLSESDGSLNLADLAFTSQKQRSLINDVTICGDHEPTAYVTEYFRGDGSTTQFYLAATPFFPASGRASIIHELFDEPQIDERIWSNSSDADYLCLGTGGLNMHGGNGYDGQTVLCWIDKIEMGGTLLLEATGISLAAGSTGILAGFFVGLNTQPGCVAGFLASAQQGNGAVTLQPLINGVASGASFPINSANQYALRVRVHCPEIQRQLTQYHTHGDNGTILCGGQFINAPGKVQMEIQEYINGVAGMPVTLYDGSITSLPTSCTLVAASSIHLVGAMRSLHLTNLGSPWVVSTPANGGAFTRRLGTTSSAAECQVDRTAKLVFNSGFVPQGGEQIAVSYRTVGRAVGRAINEDSQQALAQAGLPAVSAWTGTVTTPRARSSADCRNAAGAIAQSAGSANALWKGTYQAYGNTLSGDAWPGDALELDAASAGVSTQVVVRTVKLSYRASVPDLVHYTIGFANDWAEDLSIGTSDAVPADAWLPAPADPVLPSNLNGPTVSSLTGATISVNTGTAAPPGGGFEIRRRDFAFAPGEDTDLVMRTTVSNMTFLRESANDRFYIRMFDGATPPNYSEFSTALFVNLPLGS